jgi:hypothetical protein
MAASVVVVFTFWARAASLARSVHMTVYYQNRRGIGGGMKAPGPGPEFEEVME